MLRTTFVFVVLLVLAASMRAAGADTFGGWNYTAPPGYTAAENPDHVALTKQTRTGFCSLSLFEARSVVQSVRAEREDEWHNIVAHSFTASARSSAKTRTTDGADVWMTTASLLDGSGTRYAGIHYVVSPPGLIGSVLLTASSKAMLTSCERVATPFVRALVIDATRFTDPEARIETPLGRWARTGETTREYRFAAGGIYRFRSESAARIINETGTYSLRGHQLVLTPKTSEVASVSAGVVTWSRGKLEKATYTWSKRYDPATNEWFIVMSPRKATVRDGKLDGDDAYEYSDRAKPVWTLFAQPGS